MTPKRKPVLLNHRGQPMKETDTAVFATIDGLVYEAVVGGKHHPRCACKRCHRAKKKPAPLPRAVRELLRDVVTYFEDYVVWDPDPAEAEAPERR